ncbi:MAG: hypothetical protein M4579_002242 [Chaenotheca gracillima]|nr:MAG: hypothetical protein M4579_002242 [Chaenotheca gracillima]
MARLASVSLTPRPRRERSVPSTPPAKSHVSPGGGDAYFDSADEVEGEGEQPTLPPVVTDHFHDQLLITSAASRAEPEEYAAAQQLQREYASSQPDREEGTRDRPLRSIRNRGAQATDYSIAQMLNLSASTSQPTQETVPISTSTRDATPNKGMKRRRGLPHERIESNAPSTSKTVMRDVSKRVAVDKAAKSTSSTGSSTRKLPRPQYIFQELPKGGPTLPRATPVKGPKLSDLDAPFAIRRARGRIALEEDHDADNVSLAPRTRQKATRKGKEKATDHLASDGGEDAGSSRTENKRRRLNDTAEAPASGTTRQKEPPKIMTRSRSKSKEPNQENGDTVLVDNSQPEPKQRVRRSEVDFLLRTSSDYAQSGPKDEPKKKRIEHGQRSNLRRPEPSIPEQPEDESGDSEDSDYRSLRKSKYSNEARSRAANHKSRKITSAGAGRKAQNQQRQESLEQEESLGRGEEEDYGMENTDQDDGAMQPRLPTEALRKRAHENHEPNKSSVQAQEPPYTTAASHRGPPDTEEPPSDEDGEGAANDWASRRRRGSPPDGDDSSDSVYRNAGEDPASSNDGSPGESDRDSQSEPDQRISDQASPELRRQKRLLRTMTEGLRELGVSRERGKVTKLDLPRDHPLRSAIVKTLVKLVLKIEDTCQKHVEEPENTTLHTEVERLLERISRSIKRLARSEDKEDQQVIEDVYAHGLPHLVRLLKSGFKFYTRDLFVASPALKQLMRLAALAEYLGKIARAWKARPPPGLNLVRPVRNKIVPAIRDIQRSIRFELEERDAQERRQRNRKADDESHLQLGERTKRNKEKNVEAIIANRRRILERLEEEKRRTDPRMRDAELRQGLHEAASALSPDDQSNGVESPDEEPPSPPQAPTGSTEWSPDELVALCLGLERFTGNDRYVRILNDAGQTGQPLENRDLDELFEKTKEMRADLVADLESHPGVLPDWIQSI